MILTFRLGLSIKFLMAQAKPFQVVTQLTCNSKIHLSRRRVKTVVILMSKLFRMNIASKELHPTSTMTSKVSNLGPELTDDAPSNVKHEKMTIFRFRKSHIFLHREIKLINGMFYSFLHLWKLV